MKKHLKTGLLALALVAGVSGAIVSKVQAMPKAKELSYDWQRIPGSTAKPGETDPLLNATVSQAQSNYGCTGTLGDCAQGDDPNGVNPSVQIFAHN